MVFAEIQRGDKEAFFSLLDEYFAARPHLLPQNGAEPSIATDAPAIYASPSNAMMGMAGRAMAANPQATASLVSSALRSQVHKDSPVAAAASNPRIAGALGKAVASGLTHMSKSPAPEPPSRHTAASAPPERGNGLGLVASKRLGGLDTTSKGAFFGSMVRPKAEHVEVPLPVAPHRQQQSALPPPPRRAVAPAPAYVEEEPAPPEAAEDVVEGEWAEALYDYQGDASTDISMRAGDQVLVTERTSEDWWTGEVEGQRGLFPASYVKML